MEQPWTVHHQTGKDAPVDLHKRYDRRYIENFAAVLIGHTLGLVDVNHVRKSYVIDQEMDEGWYTLFHACVSATNRA